MESGVLHNHVFPWSFARSFSTVRPEVADERKQKLDRGSSMSISGVTSSTLSQYPLGDASSGPAFRSGNLSASQADLNAQSASSSQSPGSLPIFKVSPPAVPDKQIFKVSPPSIPDKQIFKVSPPAVPDKQIFKVSPPSVPDKQIFKVSPPAVPDKQVFKVSPPSVPDKQVFKVSPPSVPEQQVFRVQGNPSTNHFHNHAGIGSESDESNPLLQDFNEAAQNSTAGALSPVQQAYATLQQDLQPFALGSNFTSGSSALLTPPVSLEA
jgi:hypothetical protein